MCAAITVSVALVLVVYSSALFTQNKSLYMLLNITGRLLSALASKLNEGLITKVDMVCFSPVGYGV